MELTSMEKCWCAKADLPWCAVSSRLVRLVWFCLLTSWKPSVKKISHKPCQFGGSRHQCGVQAFHACLFLLNICMHLSLASWSSSRYLLVAMASRTSRQWSVSSPSLYLNFFCKKYKYTVLIVVLILKYSLKYLQLNFNIYKIVQFSSIV